MRELLLRDGKINGKVIFALALPAVILGLFQLSHHRTDLSDISAMKMLLRHAIDNALFPFIMLGLWALLLSVINPDQKTASILMPPLAIGMLTTIYNFAIRSGQGNTNEERMVLNIFLYAAPFLSPLLFIACCELFYPRFKNKIVAIVLASLIQDVFMQVSFFLIDSRYSSMGEILRVVLSNFLQLYLTVYFFKLFGIPYKVLTEKERREDALKEKIQAAFNAGMSREQITTAVRPEFPELRDTQIARVLGKTANPEDLLAARTVNNIFIVLISLACLPPLYIFFGLSRHLFMIEHMDLGKLALCIVLPPLIAFRLYLVYSLIEYKPYAYKILSILAGLGTVLYLGLMFLHGLNPWNIIALVCNGIVLRIALLLSSQLYPDHTLINPEDEADAPHMQQG